MSSGMALHQNYAKLSSNKSILNIIILDFFLLVSHYFLKENSTSDPQSRMLYKTKIMQYNWTLSTHH